MTQEVVILIGLQAAGKSTFYRARFAPSHALVSMDLLRNNRRPGRRQLVLLDEALRTGRSVVVDNTNPSPQDRAALIDLGRRYGARVIGYYFAPEPTASLERNRAREGRARVPDVAVFATLNRLQPPDRDEGFDEIYVVRLLPDYGFTVRPWPTGE